MSLTSPTWAPGQTLFNLRLSSPSALFLTLVLCCGPGFCSPPERRPLMILICPIVVPGMSVSPRCAPAVWGGLSDGTSSPAVPWNLLRDMQAVKGWPQQKCKAPQLALEVCREEFFILAEYEIRLWDTRSWEGGNSVLAKVSGRVLVWGKWSTAIWVGSQPSHAGHSGCCELCWAGASQCLCCECQEGLFWYLTQ